MPSLDRNNTGKAYWRSLDELADAPRFREALENEFLNYAPAELVHAPNRRHFMKLMGASMALAGAAGLPGCRRWPQRKLAPYAERPEGRIPGVPERYATVHELGGVARPVLVSSFDGRPIKVEGNPEHPLSRGAADAFAQASVLSLYDPQRSKQVMAGKGESATKSSWEAFTKAIASTATSGGAGLAVCCEATASPTVAALKKKLPQAKWFTWEPINEDHEKAGARQAFGRALRSHLHLDQAKVIACFDADPLGHHPQALKHSADWAAGRRAADEGQLSRLYVAEGTFSLTGTNADQRLGTRSSRIGHLVQMVASIIETGSNDNAPGEAGKFAAAVAADLLAHRGQGLVVAGRSQPPAVHALCHRINQVLGNVGKTVSFTEPVGSDELASADQVAALVAALGGGEVKTLVILGGNPAYDAPVDLDFAAALAKAETSIHLSDQRNETSHLCDWSLPRSHYLEAWGDARSWDGTLSVVQPLILPLYDTRSLIEVLALLAGDKSTAGYDLVRRTFNQLPGTGTEKGWRRALHDGFLADSADAPVTPPSAPAVQLSDGDSTGEYEIVFTPGATVHDGRFAGNAWLQEMPDPVTKLTWDNAAIMAARTAETLGLGHGKLARLTIGGRSMDVAVFVLPGQPLGSIALALGYGRTAGNAIAAGVGFNTFALRHSKAMHVAAVKAADIRPLGGAYELATTQDHHVISDKLGQDERDRRAEVLVRETSLADLVELQKKHDPHHQVGPAHSNYIPHVAEMETNGRTVPLQLFEAPVDFHDPAQTPYRWGMAIDLNTCTGCGACIVACQAENNIGVVGKEQVLKGREMHWIRIDRYFKGDPDHPEAAHQPVTCHHCENAPCEQVCPVAATTHDSEGLNVMIYNRCIGTRYCSNNCPYKVRRFNFFDWHYKPVKGGPASGAYLGIPDQQAEAVDPVRRLGFNPDVTVRMRGVMEKCTFCTQRIKAVTIPTKNDFVQGRRESLRIEDGTITPACEQTCPTGAIVFGDLNDEKSRVAGMFKNARGYEMLRELNVRARLRYLARVKNPTSGADEKKGGHA